MVIMKISKAKITKLVAALFLLVAISRAIDSAAILSTQMNRDSSSNSCDNCRNNTDIGKNK